MLSRIQEQDPVGGNWCMSGSEITVWVDLSFSTTGVALEASRNVIKDMFWLRPTNDARHVNLAEFNAALRGSTWPSSER